MTYIAIRFEQEEICKKYDMKYLIHLICNNCENAYHLKQ